jgi:hypothetical protein
LRHCATSRKVAGSIPDGVTGIFHWHNPSGRTMALGSTQPLTEMSTRNISWGVKAADTYGWQPCHLHVPIVLKSRSLNLPEPSRPVQACNGIALPLLLYVDQLCAPPILFSVSWIMFPQEKGSSSVKLTSHVLQQTTSIWGGIFTSNIPHMFMLWCSNTYTN